MLHSVKINNGKREFVAIKDHIEHALKKKKEENHGVWLASSALDATQYKHIFKISHVFTLCLV